MNLRNTLTLIVLCTVLTGCGAGNAPVRRARALMESGEHTQAQQVLREALQTDPDNIDIHLMRGRVAMAAGDWTKARSFFARAMKCGQADAADQVDEAIFTGYTAAFEKVFPPADRDAEAEMGRVLTFTRYMNQDHWKTKALTWTFDFLIGHQHQEKDPYVSTYWIYKRKVGLDSGTVQKELVATLTRLAKRAHDSPVAKKVVGELLREVESKETQEKLRIVLDSHKSEVEIATTTVSKMRSLSIALESYKITETRYPTGSSLIVIEPDIAPYISRMPTLDAWGTPLLVMSQPAGYLIVSAAADREFDREYSLPFEQPKGAVDDYETDIIVATDMELIQHPADVDDI